MKSLSGRHAIVVSATVLCAVVVGVSLEAASPGPWPSAFWQFATVAVGSSAFGAFIVWHRPRNRYGLVHLAIGVLFGGVVLAGGVLSRAAAQDAPLGVIAQLALGWSWLAPAPLLPLWVMAIATFPDGWFHRRAVRQATLGLTLVLPLLAVVAYLFAPPGQQTPLIGVDTPDALAGPLAAADGVQPVHQAASAAAQLLAVVAPLGAVVALLHRYRTSGPVVRQQIKWLLVGASVSVALQAIPVQAFESETLRTAASVLVVLAVPLPLVAAVIAIRKHRLWDIDVAISKGLVYTIVSAALSTLFIGIALIAGVSVGGRDTRVVAAVALGLLVSFLIHPVRQRLENIVARLLYGPQPRGVMALARLREEGPVVDAAAFASRVAEVSQSALGTGWTGVWLYVPGDGGTAGTLSPFAVVGVDRSGSAVVPHSVATAIGELPEVMTLADVPGDVMQTVRPLLPEPPGLLALLTATGSLIGLLACGPRSQPFGEDDRILMAAVARQAALALRNAGLEQELRQRLAQIEHQAVQLSESRQRLVTAQHQERRRIERDLHDGVQQKLVALAAGLRLRARAGRPAAGEALEDIADQAEEAVFALQELARGIYPSLLADQGLHPALQAHAARLPVDVRVEVEPRMRGRRLHPDVEAALYFVALEAMTNAVKHAPGARILISLQIADARRAVVLEVHDDGPGFDAHSRGGGSGTGLDNMADRIAAAGGVLSVDTVPGAGTWIRAEVADIGTVSDITARRATP